MEYQLNNLDPVHIATLIFGAFFAPAAAQILGPYVVIMLCCTIGTSWALGRRPTTSRASALRFFLLMNGTALMVTSAAARGIATHLHVEDPHWLLAPVALTIGWIGHDWPTLIKWVIKQVTPKKESN